MFLAVTVGASAPMTVTVDASDIGRKLLTSEITIEQPPKPAVFLYPKWLPGMHGPCGPIQNVAGFSLVDEQDRDIEWRRTSADPFAFRVTEDLSSERITARLRYICTQAIRDKTKETFSVRVDRV
jgi:hypothetical protein